MNTKLGTRASKNAKSGTDWAATVTHRGLPLPAKKEQIALRVDADVINWFRSQGTGWQTRMNAVLKAYCNAASQR
ncbi:MAG: BrnA antitoxin family protein [Burkholderiales bacterium]|nr:BrnA antitoxin family protein [Burkholderiales bacterium]